MVGRPPCPAVLFPLLTLFGSSSSYARLVFNINGRFLLWFILKALHFDRSMLSWDAWLTFRDDANPESHGEPIYIIGWPLDSHTVFDWSYHFPSLFLSHSWLSLCFCIVCCTLTLLGVYAWWSWKQRWSTQAAELQRGLLVSWWIPMKLQNSNSFKIHQNSGVTLMWHTNTKRSQLEFSHINIPYVLLRLASDKDHRQRNRTASTWWFPGLRLMTLK